MKQMLTYEELVLLERDIQQQKNASPSFSFFNRQKISTFYYENKKSLELARKKIRDMMDRHVKKDDDGKWLDVKVDGEFQKWQFYTEADEILYKTKYEEFMSQKILVTC